MNVAEKIIHAHLREGEMNAGAEIGLRIDQTLLQDATGTLVALELEAMGLERTKAELSAQYVDHNLIQEDNKNPDDYEAIQLNSSVKIDDLPNCLKKESFKISIDDQTIEVQQNLSERQKEILMAGGLINWVKY